MSLERFAIPRCHSLLHVLARRRGRLRRRRSRLLRSSCFGRRSRHRRRLRRNVPGMRASGDCKRHKQHLSNKNKARKAEAPGTFITPERSDHIAGTKPQAGSRFNFYLSFSGIIGTHNNSRKEVHGPPVTLEMETRKVPGKSCRLFFGQEGARPPAAVPIMRNARRRIGHPLPPVWREYDFFACRRQPLAQSLGSCEFACYVRDSHVELSAL